MRQARRPRRGAAAKMILLFVVLFGAGLAILLLLRGRGPQPTSTVPDRRTPPRTEEFTDLPIPGEADGKPGQRAIRLQGWIDIDQLEGEGAVQRSLHKLHANDAQPLGGNNYSLRGLTIQTFDPATGELLARIASPLSRIRIDVVDRKYRLGENGRAFLSDVEVTLERGAPIVPLVLRAPVLEWQLQPMRMRSDRLVQITGAGLRAEGTGLDADSAGPSLALATGGSITLTLPGGAEATLAATGPGPLSVRRIGDPAAGESKIEIAVSEGARFSATGEEPLRLDARSIRLLARSVGDGKQFEIVSADAEDEVVAESRGDTFRADTAHFTLAPIGGGGGGGRLASAELDGSVVLQGGEGTFRAARAAFRFAPGGALASAHLESSVELTRAEDVFRARTADFTFDADGGLAGATLAGDPFGSVAVGRFFRPDQREVRSARAEISGAGPLELRFGAEVGLELVGEGELRVPELDLSIRATRGLSGKVAADKKSGELVANADARLSYRGDDVATGTLRVRYSTDAAGETIVDATCEGPTTIRGSQRLPQPIVLTAREGLEARSAGGRLVVPIARGVDLGATGPGWFQARAATLRNLDWEARTFEAEGDIAYDGESGSGSADRVVARSADEIELDGSPGRPARYRMHSIGPERREEAGVEAVSIRARKDAFDATGDVSGSIQAADRIVRVQSRELHLALEPEPTPGAPRPFHVDAKGGVRGRFESAEGDSSLSCEHLVVDGLTRGTADPGGAPIASTKIRAEGGTSFEGRLRGGIRGEGDVLTLDQDGSGRLSAAPGGRVRAVGRITPTSAPYAIEADWIDFAKERLEARGVTLVLQPEPEDPAAARPRATVLEASTARLVAESSSLLLEGDAHVKGRTAAGEEWTIDAGSVRVSGQLAPQANAPADGPANAPEEAVERVEAWNGFVARFGARAEARGVRLEGTPGKLRLEGDPAQLSLDDVVWKSAWIEYDTANVLLATDQGELAPQATDGKPAWSITYESLKPFDRGDKTILALRNPRLRRGDTQITALWTLIWVDRDEWRRSGRQTLSETAQGRELRVRDPESRVTQKLPPMKGRWRDLRQLIERARSHRAAKILSEVYLEGNIEITEAGKRRARAEAIYLDVTEGHGWIRQADVLMEVGETEPRTLVRAKAEWMRISTDGSLRAEKAVITTCEHDEPHYVIETGDLRLAPGSDLTLGFTLSATRNALRFENGWSIPLPPLVMPTNEDLKPIVENMFVSNSAKFGAAVGASFNVALGKVGRGVGWAFGKLLRLPSVDIDGNWNFHGSYLGSRGALAGVGLEFDVPRVFRLDMTVSGILDSGEDRGVIRVPEDDRALLRTWFRARGRYTLDEHEWVDLAVSRQSDPGVQSEFFERDYFSYEQKDNYLHWRKANGPWYLDASVKALLEDRTDAEELPSLGVFRERTEVGRLGSLPLLWTGSLDVDYLRRREGDPQFYPPFPDGLGDQDVLRADALQRLEAPVPLGFAGLRLTPFVSARATAWDTGVLAGAAPTRVGAFAGFDLSTTLWRRFSNGSVHVIAPSVGVHGDIAVEESDGAPVPIDRVENALEGRFIDLGLRTRWWTPTGKQRVDIELRTSHGSDLPGSASDGFQPVTALGEVFGSLGGMPVGVSHDGRYSTESGDTLYSRSFLGVQPWNPLGIEVGYHVARDALGSVFYEAASAAARYRATEKWEMEINETISLLDDRGLGHSFVLRRLGHDFVMEAEIGYQAGEGARFDINLIPRLAWRRHSIGLLDTWTGAYR